MPDEDNYQPSEEFERALEEAARLMTEAPSDTAAERLQRIARQAQQTRDHRADIARDQEGTPAEYRDMRFRG